MLFTGCSAGGAGSTINYFFLRDGLPGVERAYLLADSGPLFPSDGFSRPLHDKVFEAWAVDSVVSLLPDSFDPNDFGSINTMLATEYPDDRFAVTFFRRDLNFSPTSTKTLATTSPTGGCSTTVIAAR